MLGIKDFKERLNDSSDIVQGIGRSVFFLIYNFIYSFIYLFLAMLGLPCCGDFSLVVVSGCYSLVVVRGLLIAVASLGAEHGL